MGILLIEGFDLYNGIGANTGVQAKWTGGTGVASTAMVTGRFGEQAISCPSSNANGRNISYNFTANANVTLGVAIRFTVMPVSDTVNAFIHLMSGSPTNIGLRCTTSGAIEVLRMTSTNAGTVLATSAAGVISSNTWHYLEAELVVSDASGRITVFIDGTQVINATSVDTNNAVTTVSRLKLGFDGLSTSIGTAQFDDVYLIDSATRIGERRVETVRPTADTAQKDFTRSAGSDNYALVDETTSNGDTDYVQGSNVGDTDRYTFGALSSTPSAISAVQLTAFAEKTDAASRSLALQAKSGATTSDGSSMALAASYRKFDRILETDPDTGVDWTASGVNNLEAGPKVAA